VRKTIIMGIIAATTVITGCSSASDAAPTVDKQTAAVVAGDKTPEEAAFEDFVRQEFDANDADVEAMTEMAQAICSAYDRGNSSVDVVRVATESGFSGYEAGQLNGAATAASCPEHATP
jgi:hypothetical protein